MQTLYVPKPRCLYCGDALKKIRKGEHCFPEALGTRLSIPTVCGVCNNELSKIDKSLVAESPIRILTAIKRGQLGQHIWNYDPSLNLALECQIEGNFDSPPLWPQLVLMGDQKFGLYFSYPENACDGIDSFVKAFRECLGHARATLHDPNKRRHKFKWEKIECPPDRGQFPPRIYCQRHYPDFERGMTFTCRYLFDEKQRRIIYWLDDWLRSRPRTQVSTSLGMIDPEMYSNFNPRVLNRACTKIAINCLAFYFGWEVVNYSTFRQAVRFVRFDEGEGPSVAGTGFLLGSELPRFQCKENEHLVRIVRSGSQYTADLIFFGGGAGIRTRFMGSVLEFNSFDMTIPINDIEPRISASKIIMPNDARVTWMNLAAAMPTLPIMNPRQRIIIERQRRQ